VGADGYPFVSALHENIHSTPFAARVLPSVGSLFGHSALDQGNIVQHFHVPKNSKHAKLHEHGNNCGFTQIPFAADDSRRYDLSKVSLAEIKTAIEQLSFEERAELAAWLHGWKDDEWDEQMKRDIASGKLDDVLREVEEDIKAGRVRELP
jgi:hypothetical protein